MSYTDYARVMRRRDMRSKVWSIVRGLLIALIIATPVLLLMTGCDVDSSKTIVTANEPGPNYYVHEVKLKDGTRCVVASSAMSDGGVGVTCEWKERQ